MTIPDFQKVYIAIPFSVWLKLPETCLSHSDNMAFNVHGWLLTFRAPPMETNLYNRVVATLLAIATVLLSCLRSSISSRRDRYQQPDDGVVWTESSKQRPDRADRGTRRWRADPERRPASSRAICSPPSTTTPSKSAPTSTANSSTPTSTAKRTTASSAAVSRSTRPSRHSHSRRPTLQLHRVIGLVYLAIGIYVLFRRWTAPRATHFYIFCLVSFALNTFHYTGKFDRWIGPSTGAMSSPRPCNRRSSCTSPWSSPRNACATGPPLAPAADLRARGRRGWPCASRIPLLAGHLRPQAAPRPGGHRLRRRLFRPGRHPLPAQLRPRQYSAAAPAAQVAHPRNHAGGAALHAALRRSLPHRIPGSRVLLQKVAGLSLVVLPLTFSWAIVRYRLMDTDLIFKRGVAYTLATGTLVGVYFGPSRSSPSRSTPALPEAVREWGLVLTILITAQLFDPLKRRFQSWIDQVFDRHRYDYRKALVDFGRGLSSETDLEALLRSIVDRLPSTLLVAKVAVFLADSPDSPGSFHLAASHGLPFSGENYAPRLDLGFPGLRPAWRPLAYLPRKHPADHPPAREQQRTAALLDLNYYLPCRVQDADAGRKSIGEWPGKQEPAPSP
jgi:two-component system NtrC family sensor kinase